MPSPQITLLLENPTKSNNLGAILRCAVAFGITEIHVVGYDTCAVMGAHGANKHVKLVGFPIIQQAVNKLKLEAYQIVGLLGPCPISAAESPPLRIRKDTTEKEERVAGISWGKKATTFDYAMRKLSKSVRLGVFDSNHERVCLVISKSLVHGLPERLALVCDDFVHVPHDPVVIKEGNHQEDEEQSIYLLDTPACLSIALYHLTLALKMQPKSSTDHKYEVQVQHEHTRDDNVMNERKRRREELQEEAPVGGGDLFGLFTSKDDSGDY